MYLVPVSQPLKQLFDSALVADDIAKGLGLVGVRPHVVMLQASLVRTHWLRQVVALKCVTILLQQVGSECELLKSCDLSDQVLKLDLAQDLDSQRNSLSVLGRGLNLATVFQLGAGNQVVGYTADRADNAATLRIDELGKLIAADRIKHACQHELLAVKSLVGHIIWTLRVRVPRPGGDLGVFLVDLLSDLGEFLGCFGFRGTLARTFFGLAGRVHDGFDIGHIYVALIIGARLHVFVGSIASGAVGAALGRGLASRYFLALQGTLVDLGALLTGLKLLLGALASGRHRAIRLLDMPAVSASLDEDFLVTVLVVCDWLV